MTFIPIVSLLDEVPAAKYLARAIDLYLECKLEHSSFIPLFIFASLFLNQFTQVLVVFLPHKAYSLKES